MSRRLRGPLATTIHRARARLAVARSREGLRRRAWIVLLAAFAAGALRPLLWPLEAEAPAWAGAPRALLLSGAILGVGFLVLRLLARRRPTDVAAARTLDESLDLNRDRLIDEADLGIVDALIRSHEDDNDT